MRTYQDTWNHRCKILFCCMGRSDQYKVGWNDVMWIWCALDEHLSWCVVWTSGFLFGDCASFDWLFPWLGPGADWHCGRPRFAQKTTEETSRDTCHSGEISLSFVIAVHYRTNLPLDKTWVHTIYSPIGSIILLTLSILYHVTSCNQSMSSQFPYSNQVGIVWRMTQRQEF